jgi:hypothetical protein
MNGAFSYRKKREANGREEKANAGLRCKLLSNKTKKREVKKKNVICIIIYKISQSNGKKQCVGDPFDSCISYRSK